MKKILTILIATLCFCVLSVTAIGCSQASDFVDQLFCTHEWSEGVVTKEATCFEEGELTKVCSLCNKETTESVDMISHTPLFVEAQMPTCTEPGCTDGTVCGICDKVLTGLQEVPALGHRVEIIEGYAVTCLEDGLSDGMRCTRCEETLQDQTVIKATGHSLVVVGEKEASCAEPGHAPHAYCEKCETRFGYEEYPQLSHTFVNGPTCSVCKQTDLVSYLKDPSLVSAAEVVDGQSYALAGSTLRVDKVNNGLQVVTFDWGFSFGAFEYFVSLYIKDPSFNENITDREVLLGIMMPSEGVAPVGTLDLLAEDSGFIINEDENSYYITFPETFTICKGSVVYERTISSSVKFTARKSMLNLANTATIYTPVS